MNVHLYGLNFMIFFDISKVKDWNNNLITLFKKTITLLLNQSTNIDIMIEYNGNKNKIINCINTNILNNI